MSQKETLMPHKKIQSLSLNEVVVGIEMIDLDDKIISYLSDWFSKLPCEIATFLHIIPSLPMVNVLPYETMDEIVLDGEWVKSIKNRIHEMTADLHPIVKTESMVREGAVLEALTEASRYGDHNLLVIGQESDSKDQDIPASSVVRNSHSNVLVIPEECKIGVSKILVPVDFSTSSVKALEYAISMVRSIGSDVSLEVLNIFDVPNLSSYKIIRSPAQMESMYVANHLKLLNKLIGNYTMDFPVKSHVIRKEKPSVSKYILSYAESIEADLIVIGRKGHSKLDQLLMGSVTETLLNNNKHIATLVIK